jgi:hypothetical protein
MDIIQSDSSIIDKNEDVAINLFYYVFDYDFRKGLFTDESSIYDMSPLGLQNYDYEKIADEYEEKKPENLIYREYLNFYDKLLNERWEAVIKKKLQNHYGLIFNSDKHLLVDIISLIKIKFPYRKWSEENIFIIKKLDLKIVKEEKIIEKQTNVRKLPYKKKLTDEDIATCINPFLLKESLNISLNEARKLATHNYDIKTKDKIFIPYRPQLDEV